MEIRDLQGMAVFKSDSPSIKETIEDAIRKGGANLSGADLRGADLRGADLMFVNLSGSNLNGANLNGAKLRFADLNGANLSCSNLNEADLRSVDLSIANLSGANLSWANLSWANLTLANLSEANLGSAYLRSAYLNGANLNGAKLRFADLSGAKIIDTNLSGTDLSDTILSWANLIGAKNVPYIPLACPSEGSFIGWKKIYSKSIKYLVKLRIPEDARRCSATTSKCRCDKAEVLAIECLSTGDKYVKQVVNRAYNECTYTVGEMVYPDSFDENRWEECSHGIHFFINKQDAIDY